MRTGHVMGWEVLFMQEVKCCSVEPIILIMEMESFATIRSCIRTTLVWWEFVNTDVENC